MTIAIIILSAIGLIASIIKGSNSEINLAILFAAIFAIACWGFSIIMSIIAIIIGGVLILIKLIS